MHVKETAAYSNKEKWLRKLLEWSIYSIALLPVVPYNVNSMCMMLFAVAAIVLFKMEKRRKEPEAHKKAATGLFLLFAGNFFLFVGALSYSNNIHEGLSFLNHELPMLLFPFIFFLLPVSLYKNRSIIDCTLTIFLCANLLLCMWLLLRYWQLGLFNELDKASSFNTIFRDVTNEITGKHPTYLSLYFSFAIGVAVYNTARSKQLFLKVLNVVSILLLVFLILVLASRTPVVATFAALFIYLIRLIRQKKLRWIIVLLLLPMCILFVRLTPSIYSRVMETVYTEWKVPEGMKYNSTNLRVGIYKCAWQLIGQRPITGYGTGSDEKVLNECYAQFPTDAYQITYYNTHNQYLNFWLLTGITGILLFLFSLGYAFYLALKHRDNVFLYFVILFAIGFLTENILSRQAGAVVYYFFLCFFVSVCCGSKTLSLPGEAKTLDSR